jgi:glyoxylase-like metal-dependent hydrolase (beta-lactamase superfamily II)
MDTVLTIDGDEICLLCTPGHVVDEICVYHPASKTLFAGDAIYEGTAPTTRFGGTEDWRKWIFHLNRIKKLDIQNIVPGHGRICSKSEIDRNINFLQEKLKQKKSGISFKNSVLSAAVLSFLWKTTGYRR